MNWGFSFLLQIVIKLQETSTLVIFNENKTKKLSQFHILFEEKKYL